MTQTVTPHDLNQQIQAGKTIHLLDVRTGPEYRAAHVGIAKNLPLDKVSRETVEKVLGASPGDIHIICQSGARAAKACDLLSQAGLKVIHVEGGTGAWIAAGLPVVTGKKAMGLERQVRIAAGTLVFTGVLLGFFVHPWIYALSGFVGAGLVFAGLTDTCAMGMLIAKMPWNQ